MYYLKKFKEDKDREREKKGEEGLTTWPTLPGCFMARPPLDTAAATFPSRSTTTAPTVSRHPEPFSYITVKRGVT